MTFKSSNSEWVESLPTNILIQEIRIAMGEGCIKPAHVYDLIDEALQRLSESSIAKPHPRCPRGNVTKNGCELLCSDRTYCLDSDSMPDHITLAKCVFSED